MSKEIGMWVLGSMQGISTSPGFFSPSGIKSSVPGHGCTLGCLDPREKHGELLMKIGKLHLGAQIVVSYLSSFLMCVGP